MQIKTSKWKTLLGKQILGYLRLRLSQTKHRLYYVPETNDDHTK